MKEMQSLPLTVPLLLFGAASFAAAADPCRDAVQSLLAVSRDYQKTARTIKTVCTKVDGDCTTAELESTAALIVVSALHQEMLDNCGGTTPPPPPADSPTLPGDIIVNEVMASPLSLIGQTGEWIELHNPTATDFNLNGITVVILPAGDEILIDSDVIVPARGFAVIAETGDSSLNGGLPTVDFVASFLLPNTGLSLDVRNGTTSIDEVSFDVFQTGVALQLDPDFTSDEVNWCDAVNAFGVSSLGTPGAINDQCF